MGRGEKEEKEEKTKEKKTKKKKEEEEEEEEEKLFTSMFIEDQTILVNTMFSFRSPLLHALLNDILKLFPHIFHSPHPHKETPKVTTYSLDTGWWD